MTEEQIWNCETPVSDLLGIDVPAWVDADICASTIASIAHYGCASGTYMPAVTYYRALRTMSDHGDDVLQYIDDVMGELPAPSRGESWSGMACFYLSYAIELWAGDVLARIEDFEGESA